MRTCWEIREVLADNGCGHPTRADLATEVDGRRDSLSNSWQMECHECGIYSSGVTCWEQCNGCPCCCAPIHISCDFCAFYIEHRREIAGLSQD